MYWSGVEVSSFLEFRTISILICFMNAQFQSMLLNKFFSSKSVDYK